MPSQVNMVFINKPLLGVAIFGRHRPELSVFPYPECT